MLLIYTFIYKKQEAFTKKILWVILFLILNISPPVLLIYLLHHTFNFGNDLPVE